MTKGFSLSELMIAILISSMLIQGVMRHYILVKKGYRHLTQEAEQKEEVYLLSHLLRELIASAGYFGYTKINMPPLLKGHLILSAKDKRLPQSIRKTANPNSAVLYLSQLSHSPTSLSNAMQLYSMVNIKRQLSLNAGEKIIISNCQHIEMKTIRKVANQGKRLYFEDNVTHLYPMHTVLGKYTQSYLYIAKKRDHLALYLKEGTKRAEELSQRVISMDIVEEVLPIHPLIRVRLTLNDNEKIEIDTALRNE